MLTLLARAMPDSRWRAVRRLASGPFSRCWLLESDDRRAVLRLVDAAAMPPGVDRRRELTIQRAAAALGLAPGLLFTDAEAGILVSAYCPDSGSAPSPEALGQLLARLHGAAIDAPRLNWPAYLDACRRTLARPEHAELAERFGAAVDDLLPALDASGRSALCHCDPNPDNVRAGPRGLQLIDWEYAAVTDPCYDLAAVAESHDLPADRLEALLAAYGGLDAGGRARLASMRVLYRYAGLLWHALVAERMPESAGWARRGLAADAARLEALLRDR